MGTCRESSKMERALDRFISQLRNVDKVLWKYSGKNIEKEEYPLSSLDWLDEEVTYAHDLWFEFIKEKQAERERVIKIHNEKFPPKKNEDIMKEVLVDSIISQMTPKK